MRKKERSICLAIALTQNCIAMDVREVLFKINYAILKQPVVDFMHPLQKVTLLQILFGFLQGQQQGDLILYRAFGQ